MKIPFHKFILGCAAAGLALLPGCDNKLDIRPVDVVDASQALRTSTDVEALLVGAYDALGDELKKQKTRTRYGFFVFRPARKPVPARTGFFCGQHHPPGEPFSEKRVAGFSEIVAYNRYKIFRQPLFVKLYSAFLRVCLHFI